MNRYVTLNNNTLVCNPSSILGIHEFEQLQQFWLIRTQLFSNITMLGIGDMKDFNFVHQIPNSVIHSVRNISSLVVLPKYQSAVDAVEADGQAKVVAYRKYGKAFNMKCKGIKNRAPTLSTPVLHFVCSEVAALMSYAYNVSTIRGKHSKMQIDTKLSPSNCFSKHLVIEEFKYGKSTHGGSTFRVDARVSDGHGVSLPTCTVQDFFNGTYFVFCPVIHSCFHLNIFLQHTNFVAFAIQLEI